MLILTKFCHNFITWNVTLAVPSTDLLTLQLHALFKLNSGLAADKALFNLQLVATHISFMLSHNSEEPVCGFTPFVYYAFNFYFGGERLYLICQVPFFSLKNLPQCEFYLYYIHFSNFVVWISYVSLSLCIGLPIIICHNFATELCITKGQEGYVYGWKSAIGSKKQCILDTLFVKLKNPPLPVQFNGLPENVVLITASTNVVKAALLKDTGVQISRTQVQVLVNFSMTDFGSQGKTHPNNVVDLNNLLIYQSYYTALSRSATAQSTVILQGFDLHKITGYASGALCQEFHELELLDEITALNYNKIACR